MAKGGLRLYVKAVVEFNSLYTVMPKGIFPQSYDNDAFWHSYQGIAISHTKASLGLKLFSLKLNSLKRLLVALGIARFSTN